MSTALSLRWLLRLRRDFRVGVGVGAWSRGLFLFVFLWHFVGGGFLRGGHHNLHRSMGKIVYGISEVSDNGFKGAFLGTEAGDL